MQHTAWLPSWHHFLFNLVKQSLYLLVQPGVYLLLWHRTIDVEMFTKQYTLAPFRESESSRY